MKRQFSAIPCYPWCTARRKSTSVYPVHCAEMTNTLFDSGQVQESGQIVPLLVEMVCFPLQLSHRYPTATLAYTLPCCFYPFWHILRVFSAQKGRALRNNVSSLPPLPIICSLSKTARAPGYLIDLLIMRTERAVALCCYRGPKNSAGKSRSVGEIVNRPRNEHKALWEQSSVQLLTWAKDTLYDPWQGLQWRCKTLVPWCYVSSGKAQRNTERI